MSGPGRRGLGEGLPRDAGAVLRRTLPAWGALILLALLTFGLAYVPMGRWNLGAAVAIALAKAVIVAVAFMNLRRPDPLLRLAGGASLLWIGFLLALTLADVLTRPPPSQPGTVTPRAPAAGATGARQF